MEEKNKKTKTLNDAIASVRAKLSTAGLKQTGFNNFGKYNYFELADFLPTLNGLMAEEGLNEHFSIRGNEAVMTIIKGAEKQEYTIPFTVYATPLGSKGTPMMQDVQYFGALLTYYRRYLYTLVFGISEGDIIDKIFVDGEIKSSDKKEENVIKIQPTATAGQVKILERFYQGEALDNLLKAQGVKNLADLTAEEASKLVSQAKENHKISDAQKKFLEGCYKGENLKKFLENSGVTALDDLPKEKAAEEVNYLQCLLYLKKIYTGDNLIKLLDNLKLKSLEEIPREKVFELVEKIKNKKEK